MREKRSALLLGLLLLFFHRCALGHFLVSLCGCNLRLRLNIYMRIGIVIARTDLTSPSRSSLVAGMHDEGGPLRWRWTCIE
jgi:hypothetical protein